MKWGDVSVAGALSDKRFTHHQTAGSEVVETRCLHSVLAPAGVCRLTGVAVRLLLQTMKHRCFRCHQLGVSKVATNWTGNLYSPGDVLAQSTDKRDVCTHVPHESPWRISPQGLGTTELWTLSFDLVSLSESEVETNTAEWCWIDLLFPVAVSFTQKTGV